MKNIIKIFILLLPLFAVGQTFHGSGSRDLFPNGNGGRAYMLSSLGRHPDLQEAWPFPDLCSHYVYAKQGEFVAVGSSAMGYVNGGVRLTAPDGTVYTHTGSATGRITNRAAELAGPRLPGGGGNTFVPYEREVLAGQEGVWKVEFLPVAPQNSDARTYFPPPTTADTWTQQTGVSVETTNDNIVIAAWDVSVRSNANGPWEWVPGRVYVNLLNLFIPQVTGTPSSYPENRSFGGGGGGDPIESIVASETNMGGGQTRTHNNLTCPQGGGEWRINVQSSGWGDEIYWEFRDTDDNVLLSGGSYDNGFDDTQTVHSSNGPFTFFIESQGTFNDNTPSYSVTCVTPDNECDGACGAVVYVLTKDGYVYRVNNNGNYGVGFVFFSNHRGFVDKDNNDEPLYKSVNTSANISDFVHSPLDPDNGNQITNKIFYTLPADDLPATVGPVTEDSEEPDQQAVPGGVSTWLRVPRIPPSVDEVTVIGYDMTVGQISNKGGWITFVTDNLASRYTITIKPADYVTPSDPGWFEELTLTGPAQEGFNQIEWDGKDGGGTPLPEGTVEAVVGVALQTAEVHFPYIDMEINPKGIIIELMTEDFTGVEQDIVYWDDSDIDNATGVAPLKSNPTNASHTEMPNGISSNANGHKWGSYGNTSGSEGNNGNGDYGFGNNKSIDTWTFVDGEEETFTAEIIVKIADVEVESINSSYSGVVSVGDTWTYTVNVVNNGQSTILTNEDEEAGPLSGPASFMFYVPPGISINPAQVIMNTSCGVTIQGTPTFVDNIYTAKLNMPVDCQATFTIPVEAVSGIMTGDGHAYSWATMLRPNDFTDPDATNDDPEVPPTDPFFEAEGVNVNANNDLFLNPGSFNITQTNNIKTNYDVEMYADVAVTKTVDPPSDYSAYQQIKFTLTATNNGESDATNVQVTDVLTSSYGYVSQTPSKGSYDPNTGIWTIGTLEKDDVETLELTVVIQGADQQTNTATIEAAEYDPNLSNNESNEITTDAVFETDVEIVKTGFRTGDNDGNATFTLTVRNNGPVIATNVVVTDDLTTRYNFVNPASNHTVSHGSASWTGTQNRNITWTIGTLLVNETAVMTFTAANNAAGDRSNTASVTITENDIAPSNNSSTLVEPPFTGAPVDLAIQKTVDNTSPTVGSLVEFTITLTRISGGLTTGVVVTDLLPNGYAYHSHTASQGSYNKVNGKWSVGIIDSNTPRTLVIEAYVKMPSNVPDEYKNIAAITHSSQGDNNPTNNIANAVVVPNITDLAISKIVDESNPGVGEQVVFTIEVTNNGPANATGVVVYDKLPNGYTWINDDSSEAYTPGTGIWTIGNLTSGASINIDITVEVNPTGQYLNKAEVYGNQQETDYTNNSAEVQTTPDCTIRNISPNVIEAP